MGKGLGLKIQTRFVSPKKRSIIDSGVICQSCDLWAINFGIVSGGVAVFTCIAGHVSKQWPRGEVIKTSFANFSAWENADSVRSFNLIPYSGVIRQLSCTDSWQMSIWYFVYGLCFDNSLKTGQIDFVTLIPSWFSFILN